MPHLTTSSSPTQLLQEPRQHQPSPTSPHVSSPTSATDPLSHVLRQLSQALRADDIHSIVRIVQAHDRAVVNARCDVPSSHLGMTPLHAAVRTGNPQYVNLLIARGADVHARERHGRTPLLLALYHHYLQAEYLSIILPPTPYNNNNNHSIIIHPFPITSSSSNTTSSSSITSSSPHPHVTAPPALGFVAVASGLLHAGADVNAKSPYGTPLHICAQSDNIPLAQLLIAHGASVNSTDAERQNTPLHRAVINNVPNMASLLLHHGANVHSTNIAQDTPLHSAAECGFPDLVLLLLRAGADPTLRNAEKNTPLDMARSSINPERFLISLYLQEYTSQPCADMLSSDSA